MATSASAGGPVDTKFTFTGGEQVYNVPVATTAVHVVVVGAPGGDGATGSSGGLAGHGGLGALADANVPVTPGGLLFVEVGAPGASGSTFGGAGAGGAGAGAGGAGGGGGGASDVRSCSITAVVCAAGGTLQSRLLIAGGGGGGGSGFNNVTAANGGDAGSDGTDVIAGPSGGDAGRFSTPCMANAGTNAQSGGLGLGGTGGVPAASSNYGGGGGGGGGLCGGGGGGALDNKPGAGGGGGSSFFSTAVTDLPLTPTTTAPPSVTITYTDLTAPSITIKAPGTGETYDQGSTVAADYSCTDDQGGAGVAGCNGPVAPGAPLDTSTTGKHEFAVTATDKVGNSVTRSVEYEVVATAANVSGVTQSARRWREGNALPSIARTRVGTTFSVTLDKPATLRFSFTQRRAGRRVGSRCVRPTKRNAARKRCKRTVVAGKQSFAGHTGVNRVRFQGRITRHKRLKPGRYTLVITAVTPQGLTSPPRRLTFTIVR